MTELAGRFMAIPDVLSASPIFAIGLTLSAFFAGNWLFARLGKPLWMPPVVLSAVMLAAVIAVLSLDYVRYQQGALWITVLLGPATVALGIPLYQQIHHIRAMWKPIVVTLPLAATMAAVYAVVIAWAMGATPEVLASLAPKSVTAPIAIGITEQLGGVMPLMMGGLLITGVMATACVGLLAKRLRLKDARILGFVLGVNGHVIGTVRAFEISPTAGAFASLGMSLTGIFSALFLPLAWRLVGLQRSNAL